MFLLSLLRLGFSDPQLQPSADELKRLEVLGRLERTAGRRNAAGGLEDGLKVPLSFHPSCLSLSHSETVRWTSPYSIGHRRSDGAAGHRPLGLGGEGSRWRWDTGQEGGGCHEGGGIGGRCGVQGHSSGSDPFLAWGPVLSCVLPLLPIRCSFSWRSLSLHRIVSPQDVRSLHAVKLASSGIAAVIATAERGLENAIQVLDGTQDSLAARWVRPPCQTVVLGNGRGSRDAWRNKRRKGPGCG